jgi:hypothetical protein
MNEGDWLGCTDPLPMLQFLRDKASARKLRLFAVACCRRVSEYPGFGRGAAVAERAADGLATDAELAAARAEEDRGFQQLLGQFSYVPAPPDLHGAAAPLAATASSANEAAETASTCAAILGGDREPPAQAALLRDIFGNPFRAVRFNPALRIPTVTSLCQAAYEECSLPSGDLDATRLAMLADALEQSGCTSADILDHLRAPGPHVRGCWAVDVVLGKE